MRRVTSSIVAILLLLAAGGTPVRAQAPGQNHPEQPQQPAPVFKAGTVTIKFVGTANVNEQVVRAFLASKAGGPFTLENHLVSYPWKERHDGGGAFLLRRTRE